MLDTTIARLKKNYKPFFEKNFPKRGGMLYFWHNAQIPKRFTGNLTKHETAGGVSNKNTINFRKLLSGSCTAEKAVLR